MNILELARKNSFAVSGVLTAAFAAAAYFGYPVPEYVYMGLAAFGFSVGHVTVTGGKFNAAE